MDSALLPALIPTMMLSTVVLAPSCGQRAKASVHARNSVLLTGMGALLAADLCFAFVSSAAGGRAHAQEVVVEVEGWGLERGNGVSCFLSPPCRQVGMQMDERF
jgi:hypothetical protein